MGMDLFLRIAPELYLKRLVVGGFERVFEINRNFRNEGISVRHNPEFTMLEYYQAYAAYEDLMALTEDMVSSLVKELFGTYTITYNEQQIDFTPPWRRLRWPRPWRNTAISTSPPLTTRRVLPRTPRSSRSRGPRRSRGQAHHGDLRGTLRKEAHPADIHHPVPHRGLTLAKRNAQNPDITERFELYISGMEIANGFNELNDPEDQRERFEFQIAQKEEGATLDDDYITALEYGLPPTAGQGIGIDRLTMLLTDSASIREVILFPLLRP
jgi:lysyl-tRNA synthetase class 2